MKLKDLAESLGCELIGNPEIEIVSIAPIESAQSDQLTFLSNKRYTRYLSITKAAAVILEDRAILPEGMSGLISPNPYLTFAEAMEVIVPLLETFRGQKISGIDPSATISPTAKLGNKVAIGPFTVVGENVQIGDHVIVMSHCAIYSDAEIGAGSLIHSHCVIREGCRIGAKVILQNNVTIGSDGFGYAKRSDNSWKKIPQMGYVVIEDEVEIGSGSVIDRAAIGRTVVGKGTKIDNLVQIGHGSTVGQDTLLCAQVGLAGSTTVGNRVILGGQVGAAGHLEIGDQVIATAQSGIPNSVEAGKIISGYPAIDNRDWLKSSAIFSQLTKLQKEIRELRKRINKLEGVSEK